MQGDYRAILLKPLVEGLVLKSYTCSTGTGREEAPRGGAGIEIVYAQLYNLAGVEAPRGGAGIEMHV